MSNERLDKFAAHLSKWESAYAFSLHSYVGVKDSSGISLLYGKIGLEVTRPEIADSPFHFESEHLVAGQFAKVAESKSIKEILSKAQTGKMDGLHGTIGLIPERENSWSPYWYPHKQPFPSSLSVSGKKPDGILRDQEIDWELASGDVPFENFNELLITLGLPAWRHGGESCSLEIAAVSPAVITDGSTITNGNALIEVQAAKSLDVRNLKLGFQFMEKGSRSKRGSVSGQTLRWETRDELQFAVHSMPVNEALRLQAYLSFEGVPLDQRAVFGAGKQVNPRSVVHQAFDPDIRLLSRVLLNPKKSEAEDFEVAVATLLHLLGFSSCNYGVLTEFRDGPDIIAVTPSGSVAVIECTTGFLDAKDKLSKLVGRASRIRTRLAEAGHDKIEMLPVIVTSLVRDEVKASIPAADKLRIAVVCREELENALKQITLAPVADKIFEHTKETVPSAQDDLFAGLLRGNV
jgi:hypothetical protein